MKKQAGFTLVELVVVIAVLGILAATALPRFVNVQSTARAASMQGVAAAARSASNLARASWVAAGSTGGTAAMEGVAAGVAVNASGWPTSAVGGIEAAMQTTQADANVNISHAAGVSTFASKDLATCKFTYTEATGSVDATAVTKANCGG